MDIILAILLYFGFKSMSLASAPQQPQVLIYGDKTVTEQEIAGVKNIEIQKVLPLLKSEGITPKTVEVILTHDTLTYTFDTNSTDAGTLSNGKAYINLTEIQNIRNQQPHNPDLLTPLVGWLTTQESITEGEQEKQLNVTPDIALELAAYNSSNLAGFHGKYSDGPGVGRLIATHGVNQFKSFIELTKTEDPATAYENLYNDSINHLDLMQGTTNECWSWHTPDDFILIGNVHKC